MGLILSGHVFVALSDVTRLRCHAWLLPTDASLHITDPWLATVPVGMRERLTSAELRERWGNRGPRRTLVLDPCYPALGRAPAPVPIATDVGAFLGKPISWYLDGLSEFVAAAVEATEGSNNWRTKRLFAVPFIGTGAGGLAAQKGEMQRAILERLRLDARKHDVDLALVLFDRGAYTAAQAVRSAETEWQLHPSAKKRLDALATHATHGRLVLFMGAGLSGPAGLPVWSELLDQLAADEGLKGLESLKDLAPLDASTILERRFRSIHRDLKTEVARLTSTPCCALGHAILAALPVRERVTTNYDECIEQSLEAAHHKLSVLPNNLDDSEGSWLLKLHGTIGEPAQIVITRQDYLRYESQRGALYGIVQAMMLTRHILFVGFSLTDPNFNALVDEVRRALEGLSPLRSARGSRFGTAFVSDQNTTAAELWDNDLYIEQLGDFARYPRQLEIALDYLSAKTTSSSDYLLDENFAAMLTEEQNQLKELLIRLSEGLNEQDIASPTFEPVVELLKRYGLKTLNRKGLD